MAWMSIQNKIYWLIDCLENDLICFFSQKPMPNFHSSSFGLCQFIDCAAFFLFNVHNTKNRPKNSSSTDEIDSSESIIIARLPSFHFMAEIIISSELNKQINVIKWYAVERWTQIEKASKKPVCAWTECSNMCEFDWVILLVWGIVAVKMTKMVTIL